MTITYTSQSNLTIQGTAFTGDAGDCIVFDSCTNITVRRCHFTASAGVGLKFNSCAGTILIENCYFDDLNGGIYIYNTTATLTVRENHCGDVARSGKIDGARGQFIQANACTFANGLITDNYVRMTEGGGDKEDHISMFDTSGTSGNPLVISNNWLRGRHTSASGGGILVGEGDGNYIHVLTNTVINVGVVGIAVAGGAFNVVDGNLLYSETFSTGDADYNMNSVGIYEDVFTGSGSTVLGTHDNTFTDNVIDWEYYTGGTNPTYFPNAGSSPPTVSGNNTSTDLSYLLTATEPIPDTDLVASGGGGGGGGGSVGGGSGFTGVIEMPSYYEIVPPFTQFFDGNGNPLSGGKLYTYTGGTSSTKTTYREIDAVTANANPIVLDSSGYTPYGVYGTTGSYKLVLKTAADVTVRTRDHVYGINDVTNRGWVLLSSQVASASSSIDFTSFSSSYSIYRIECYGITSASDNVNLYIRTSSNGGTSYDSGSGNYHYAAGYTASSASSSAAGSASATEIVVCNLGTGTGEHVDLTVDLAGLTTTTYKTIRFRGAVFQSTPVFNEFTGGGMRASTSQINAIRFVLSSGNIASGTFKLFGMAES